MADERALGGITAADETHCLRSVVEAVNTGLRRLTQGTLRSMALADADFAFSAGANKDYVSAADCVEFLRLAESVIASLHGQREKLQAVLFDAPFDLIGTLANVVSARLRTNPGTSLRIVTGADQELHLVELKQAALRCLKSVTFACAATETRAEHHVAADDDILAGFLESLLVSAYRTHAVVPAVFGLLGQATAAEAVRVAAAEVLFVLTLRLDCALCMSPGEFASLIDAMAFDPSSDVRCLLCAAARDVVVAQCDVAAAGRHQTPTEQDHHHRLRPNDTADVGAEWVARSRALFDVVTSPTTLRAVVKLLVLDDAADMRLLCAGILRALLSSAVLRTSAGVSESDLLDVSEAIVARLGDITSNTVVLGGNRVAMDDDEETGILAAALGDLAVLAARDSLESFYMLCFHRHVASAQLVRLLFRDPAVAAASAKTLRTLLERSPPHYTFASELSEGAAIATLCRTALQFDLAQAGTALAVQVLCVEVTICLGLIFLSSPRARRTTLRALTQLQNTALTTLPPKLRAHMSNADLDYFEDLMILDESAVLLNDESVRSIAWEDDMNLTLNSIQLIVESQELRPVPDDNANASWRTSSLAAWKMTNQLREMSAASSESLAAGARHGNFGGGGLSAGPQPTTTAVRQRACMAFSLISYALHLVISNAAKAAASTLPGHADDVAVRMQHAVTMSRSAGHVLPPPPDPHFLSSAHRQSLFEQSSIRAGGDGASQGRTRVSAMDQLVSDYSPDRNGEPSFFHRGGAAGVGVSRSQSPRPATSAASRALQYPSAPAGQAGSARAAAADGHPGVADAFERVSHRLKLARQSATAARRQQDEATAPLRSQFAQCLALVKALSQHFAVDDSLDERGRPVFEKDASGLVIRRARSPSISTAAAAAPRRSGSPSASVRSAAAPVAKMQNPWAAVKRSFSDPKRWDASAVEEGDLFYFAIPLQALTVTVVDAVIAKARGHLRAVKKALAVAPHNQKNRRHFLDEMFHTIMPGIIARLLRLSKFLVSCTEAHVQMALTVLPSVVSSISRSGGHDKVVDCGNLINVVDYLSHYFSKQTGIPGIIAASGSSGVQALLNRAASPAGASSGRHAATDASPNRQYRPASPGGEESSAAGRPGAPAGIPAALVDRYLAPHGISIARDRALLRGRPRVLDSKLSRRVPSDDDDDDSGVSFAG
jgi:hypothetical protein